MLLGEKWYRPLIRWFYWVILFLVFRQKFGLIFREFQGNSMNAFSRKVISIFGCFYFWKLPAHLHISIIGNHGLRWVFKCCVCGVLISLWIYILCLHCFCLLLNTECLALSILRFRWFFFSFKWVCCLMGEITFGHSSIVLICLSKMLYSLLICFSTQSRCPTVLCNTGIQN